MSQAEGCLFSLACITRSRFVLIVVAVFSFSFSKSYFNGPDSAEKTNFLNYVMILMILIYVKTLIMFMRILCNFQGLHKVG